MDIFEQLRADFVNVANRYRDLFLSEYFDAANPDVSIEFYWVADKVGSILSVNDYFFGLDDIRYAVDHHISSFVIFDWYEYANMVYDLSGLKENVTLEVYVNDNLPYNEDLVKEHYEHIQDLEYQLTKAKEEAQEFLRKKENGNND